MWIFQFFSNFLRLKSVTASKLLQNNKRITSSCLNNDKITKSSSSTKRQCLKNEAFADIWWYRVKSRPWTKFKQSNYIVSWFHYVVKHAITLARIETCWCWWWRWLFFSEQFLISYMHYMVIPIITYSLDKLVFNTLAITLNVLLKAITDSAENSFNAYISNMLMQGTCCDALLVQAVADCQNVAIHI